MVSPQYHVKSLSSISEYLIRLRLPGNDSQGRPITYAARGASLNESDRVGDGLEENEVITSIQNVTAG
jgi:hypothetical protein